MLLLDEGESLNLIFRRVAGSADDLEIVEAIVASDVPWGYVVNVPSIRAMWEPHRLQRRPCSCQMISCWLAVSYFLVGGGLNSSTKARFQKEARDSPQ